MRTAKDLGMMAERKGFVKEFEGRRYHSDDNRIFRKYVLNDGENFIVLDITEEKSDKSYVARYSHQSPLSKQTTYLGEFGPRGRYKNDNARKIVQLLTG